MAPFVLPAARAAAEPRPQHHVNVPKPVPAAGDAMPFVADGSPADASLPTVGVIGDSVARDYAYYLARVLRPYARVVDGALGGCPAGTVRLLASYYGERPAPLRGGECPALVPAKQRALIERFAPRVVVWHSENELWDLDTGTGRVPAGSPQWRNRILTSWDETLRRVTRRHATVVVVMPLWLEHDQGNAHVRQVQQVRALYAEWAARRHVTVFDPAPVACPSGPPCDPVNGLDFRPDGTHFDDPGGMRVATDFMTRTAALRGLIGRHASVPAG